MHAYRSTRKQAQNLSQAFAPRGLKHSDAATYVGLSKAAFDQEVKAQRLPLPIFPSRKPKVWDRVALDEAFDRHCEASTSTPERDHDFR